MVMRFFKGVLIAATTGIGAAMLAPIAANAAVVCGQVITADTTLGQDLACPGDGIIVDSSNVVLNLGGHTLTGPAPAAGTAEGVAVGSDRHNVTVTNGTIRNFDFGVNMRARATGSVLSLQMLGSHIGVNTQTDSSGSRIARNTFATESNAIQLGGNAHLVEGNIMAAAGGAGVLVSGNDNTISGNRISDSGAPGISILAFPTNPGPFVGNQIDANVISGSGRLFNSSAVSINNGQRTVVQGNTVTGRRATPGIFIFNSAGTVVASNYLTSNNEGVLVRGTSSNTQVVQNRADQNAFAGFAVESSPTDTVLSGNVAMRSTGNGIDVRSPSTTLTANTSVLNSGYGIFAVNGATDGGGNRAYANGQPSQCTANIRCA